jgi:methylase of polypeptide subunit release factors
MSTQVLFSMLMDAKGDASSQVLAEGLGWKPSDLKSRSVSQGGTRLDVVRGHIASQSAAIFATVASRNGYEPLESAALYGYQTATDWGLLSEAQGVTIFNTQWVSGDQWFRLPTLSWSELASQEDLRSALSPSGILSGALERIASKRVEPTRFLQPVDDELVSRLDAWRDDALRYAKDAVGVDQRLQTLFAQLFVLRTIEDRKLESRLPTLLSALSPSGDLLRPVWHEVMVAANLHVGSELFEHDVAETLPDHIVFGVIRDLYYPRGLPSSSAKYDFSWIEADVLGSAYEKYLSTVLHPAPVDAQLDIFQTPQRGSERINVRKKSGVFYTPRFITTYLAEKTIAEFYSRPDVAPDQIPTTIDFSCGSGSFLVAVVDTLLKHLKQLEPERHWARELIDGGFIAGIDVDANAVTAARTHLWQRLVEEPDALPLPNLSQIIVQADGLNTESWGSLDKQYDIVVGNPPFVATSQVEGREQLEKRFKTAVGRFDFSYLFIEQSLKVLKPHGFLGMVAPNRLYRNKNGAILREVLAERTSLLTLIDFGSTRPFPDASAYIACIIAQLRTSKEVAPETVQVIEVKGLRPEFMASLLLEADSTASDSEYIRSYRSGHPSGAEPWQLLSAKERAARVVMSEETDRLDTLAQVVQGIRTGANDFFIFTISSSDEVKLCRAVNGLDDSAVLEIDLLEPVVYGSEVERYQVLQPERRLLYPYRRNLVIPESELQELYPKAHAYFSRNRDILGSRTSIKEGGRKWFELVRSRDETWLRSPKLLIRDLAPTTAFALDRVGETFLVGGTAVVPEQPELLLPLLAYLNSSVINALVKRLTPQFRGNYQKFEPQHLQGVPVFRKIYEDPDTGSQLSALAEQVIEARASDMHEAAASLEKDIDAIISKVAAASGVTFGA